MRGAQSHDGGHQSIKFSFNRAANSQERHEGQSGLKGKGRVAEEGGAGRILSQEGNTRAPGNNQSSPRTEIREAIQVKPKGGDKDLSTSSKDTPDNDSDPFTSSQNSASTPPTLEDIDRWTYHTDLRRFGESLRTAAKAVFPNEKKSRYTAVSVLMLQWEDEDPKLPVSIEINKLATIFDLTYNFRVNQWSIPDENCHFQLAEKVMGFVKPADDSRTHLKIVYYAGHARLMDTRVLALTSSSWRNKNKSKCPMVKWGAIQSFIEESLSDSLILLDCCASGAANTSEGSGVTEVISACAWNQIANGVGPYSLTSALAIELESLSQKPSFSVGELYRNVYLRIQSWMPESKTKEGNNVERHPAPIHLVLTQESKRPRSIQLSVEQAQRRFDLPRTRMSDNKAGYLRITPSSTLQSSARTPLQSTDSDRGYPEPRDKFPMLAFAVRLRETFVPDNDMKNLFLEWLQDMPAIAEEVMIEARFDSFSTLLIVSIPFSFSAYMPFDPAVVSLGPISSDNRMLVSAHANTIPVTAMALSPKRSQLPRSPLPTAKDFVFEMTPDPSYSGEESD